MHKISRNFYLQDTLTVAQELIGTYIVKNTKEGIIAGRITETEAYIGAIDKASHAYNGKFTPRTKIMFGNAGYSYVYLIYGMYYCFNVVTEPVNCASAVLIRGVNTVVGYDIASYNRYKCKYKDLKATQIKNFTNGPGKLCIALQITKEDNGKDLLEENLFITKSLEGIENEQKQIKVSKRIGIDYAEEAKDFLWRFYI